MSIIAASIAKIGVGFGQQHVARIGLADGGNDARSGYWRLFFYQMQEEALQTENKKEELVVAKVRPKPVTTKPTKKVKKQEQLVQETPRVQITKPPLTYPLPATVQTRPNVLELAWQATLYVRTLVAKGQKVAVQLERDINERRKRRQRDIELLLLFS